MSHQTCIWWRIRWKIIVFSQCVPLCRRGIWCVIQGYPQNWKRGSARWAQKWLWLNLGRPLLRAQRLNNSRSPSGIKFFKRDWTFWELETVSANRVAAINHPIDDTDPIQKFSVDPGGHTDWQNPAEFSPKREADTEFQYRPHIVDTDIDCRHHFCGRYFRDSYISSEPHQGLSFVGNSEGQIRILQARLKLASKIEHFKRDCFFLGFKALGVASNPICPAPV